MDDRLGFAFATVMHKRTNSKQQLAVNRAWGKLIQKCKVDPCDHSCSNGGWSQFVIEGIFALNIWSNMFTRTASQIYFLKSLLSLSIWHISHRPYWMHYEGLLAFWGLLFFAWSIFFSYTVNHDVLCGKGYKTKSFSDIVGIL